MSERSERLRRPLIVGFGITGRAVATALIDEGHQPIIVDDSPKAEALAAAAELGLEIVVAPDPGEFDSLCRQSTVAFPAPGLPDRHRLFSSESAPVIWSEFDLASGRDDRLIVAITGTNGKTTVTLLVVDALRRSGLSAVGVGNTETPLVAAIADLSVDVFVVEASSFRLAHSARFIPDVAAWLNFAPDHLDAHSSLDAYRAAKESIFAHLGPEGIAVVNREDDTVWGHRPQVANVTSFGVENGDWSIVDGFLLGPDGPVVEVAELPRSQPHDLANAAAIAAIARAAGATIEGIASALVDFTGFDHRVQRVGEWGDVSWYNDSKATVPHATAAAVGGFDSVVLIAGGRNKGLDLSVMADLVPPVRALIAIGDAGPELEVAFEGVVPTRRAASMAEAVEQAGRLAAPGDVVLLSPGCTSFDWYQSYSERGHDYTKEVLKMADARPITDAVAAPSSQEDPR